MTTKEHLTHILQILDPKAKAEGLSAKVLLETIEDHVKTLKSANTVAPVDHGKMDFLSSPAPDIPPVRIKDGWLYVQKNGRWEHESDRPLTPQKIRKLALNKLPYSREKLKAEFEGNLPFEF